jgi:hypothetical protein
VNYIERQSFSSTAAPILWQPSGGILRPFQQYALSVLSLLQPPLFLGSRRAGASVPFSSVLRRAPLMQFVRVASVKECARVCTAVHQLWNFDPKAVRQSKHRETK